jgi:hypothetical protein
MLLLRRERTQEHQARGRRLEMPLPNLSRYQQTYTNPQLLLEPRHAPMTVETPTFVAQLGGHRCISPFSLLDAPYSCS